MLAFALPDITEAEVQAVVDVLRSGWITTGPKARELEAAFAEAVGGGVEAVAVNSATAGLHLALEAAGVGPGSEVVLPVHTFTATAEVVCYLGATPVFADVCPGTLCLDPAAVERLLTPRTRAVVPVHYAGRPCAMAPIMELARGREDLAVVEDAAHAFPTTYQGRPVGGLDTAAAVFSFYATKPLATGEGGMVTTRSKGAARRMRLMRLHGIDRDVFERYRAPGAGWYYEVVAPGYKYNLTDIAAAIGLEQLKRSGAMLRRRAEIAAAYDRGLTGLPLEPPPPAAAGDGLSYHLYPVLLADEAPIGRDRLSRALLERGIGTSVHYISLHLHPYWRDTYRLRPDDFPVATAASRRLLSLPIYSKMTDGDVAAVIEAVRDALDGRP